MFFRNHKNFNVGFELAPLGRIPRGANSNHATFKFLCFLVTFKLLRPPQVFIDIHLCISFFLFHKIIRLNACL